MGAAIFVALLVFVGLLAGPSEWRDQLVVNALPGGPVAELKDRGDRHCTGVVEVPRAAGRAEFSVVGRSTIRARVDVQGIGGIRRGSMDTVSVRDGVARLQLPRAVPSGRSAKVCITSGQRADFTVVGDGNAATLRLVGAERQSWFSQLGRVLDRAGKAKGFPLNLIGGWGALILGVAALGLAIGSATWIWSRTDTWRPGRRTWTMVAMVAVMHAWTWAILVPPFQVPDESSHFQYASYIADHGKLPTGELTGQPPYSESHLRAEELLHTAAVAFRPTLRPPWSDVAQRQIDVELDGTSLDVPNVHTNATSQPPLYYVSVVVAAVGGGDALDVLARMRLLSGLWLAVAALGAVALIRFAAPRHPRWALTGGLSVALFPLLGFLAGGVTPDVAMTALSLWAFAAAVRCWRQGPSAPNVSVFAVVLVLLALTKLTALAIVPGLLVIVALSLVRQWRAEGNAFSFAPVRRAIAWAAVPVAVYVIYTLLSERSIVPGVVGSIASTPLGDKQAIATGNLRESLSVTWQLFLPRPPFMQDFFVEYPLWHVWLDGLVGRFGYLDYNFPEAVRQVIVGVWVVVVALAVVGIVSIARGRGWRAGLAPHAPLLLGGVVAIGLLLSVIGRMDYNSRVANGPPFQQARYLLPGLPVALLAVPLALRAIGRRSESYFGVMLVGGAVLWALSAFAVTLTRYYG